MGACGHLDDPICSAPRATRPPRFPPASPPPARARPTPRPDAGPAPRPSTWRRCRRKRSRPRRRWRRARRRRRGPRRRSPRGGRRGRSAATSPLRPRPLRANPAAETATTAARRTRPGDAAQPLRRRPQAPGGRRGPTTTKVACAVAAARLAHVCPDGTGAPRRPHVGHSGAPAKTLTVCLGAGARPVPPKHWWLGPSLRLPGRSARAPPILTSKLYKRGTTQNAAEVATKSSSVGCESAPNGEHGTCSNPPKPAPRHERIQPSLTRQPTDQFWPVLG